MAATATGGGAGEQIKIVGSSTVYPFTNAVAEQFQRDNASVSVIVESTGTGAGMKLFCAGSERISRTSTNASRQIKKSEYEACAQAGVKTVIEVPVGIDGLTLIEAKMRQPEPDPGGHLQGARRQSVRQGPEHGADLEGRQSGASGDQDPGPRPAADFGHARQPRRSLSDKGCDTDPAMKALKKSDDDKHKEICTKVREDGAFVEAGENDNLLVQKVAADPGTLGVLGYSYLEENADKVRAGDDRRCRSDRSRRSADLSYPGARKLYIYIKGEHLRAKPHAQGPRRRLRQGVGQGRPARADRPRPVRWRRCRRGRRAGDGAEAARSGDA